jgi:hypothetical protein
MKIDIRPNLDQIRFYAKSAMHAWDHQDLEGGCAQVIADMEALLAYLDALNDGEGVVVTAVSRVKAGVRVERSTREGDFFDLTDRYVAQRVQGQIDNDDHGDASSSVIPENRMGMHDPRRGTVNSQLNLKAAVSRSTKR